MKVDRLDELAAWEGDEDVPAVSAHAIKRARQFVELLKNAPSMVPSLEGGVHIEWVSGRSLMTVELFNESDPERLDGEVFIMDMDEK